jgi:hypothetical protein
VRVAAHQPDKAPDQKPARVVPLQVEPHSAIDGEEIMATATRMGRRPLPDEDRRDKPFRIRMTDEEREQVDSAAETAGDTSSSRWARRVLLKAAGRELARKQRRKT